ncbi:MAG: ATP-binding protein [Leptospirales bacterium]|nr:ATP-binding protein [Leptospirales bacterium]
MPEKIIETTNTRAIKNAVRHCVDRNGMMAVVAEIGSGKTTMFDLLEEHWQSHPDKFRVVTVKSFDSPYTKIGIIMRFLLESLNPKTHIPRGNERMYKLLATELRKYAKKNFKIILMIDEAQDLRKQTYYDIKKIHEIAGNGMSHLFSVVLFGKPSRKWDRLYAGPEIGYRMDITFLEQLNEEEIVRIAEMKHNIRFENDKVRKRFCASLQYKTPLGIKYFSEALKREMGIGLDDAIYINAELVIKIPTITMKIRLKQASITQQQLADFARKVSPNRKWTVQRISEWLNGHIPPDDSAAQELHHLSEQILANAYDVRRNKISGVSA